MSVVGIIPALIPDRLRAGITREGQVTGALEYSTGESREGREIRY